MSTKRRKSVVGEAPASPMPAAEEHHVEAAATASAEPVIPTSSADFLPVHPEYLDRYILPTYLALLIAYSLSVARVTGCASWTMLVFYAAQMSAFFAWHWQAHNKIWWVPFNKGCYQYHKIHHWERFPPEAFFGSAKSHSFYGDAAKTAARMSSWAGSLPLASSPSHEALVYMLFVAIIAAARLVFGVSWPTIGFAVLQALAVGVVGNYLHTSFHVRKHWLSRYTWWKELQVLHYIHHLGSARHNYAMVNFTLDRAFGLFFPTHDKLASAAAAKRAASAAAGAKALAAAGVELPEGMSPDALKSALRTSPLSYALFVGADVTAATRALSTRPALARGVSAVLVRLGLVAAGLWAFFRLQDGVVAFNDLVSGIPTAGTTEAAAAFGIIDRGHAATQGAYAALAAAPATAGAVVSALSLATDAAALGVVVASVAGSSVRPFLASILMLATRALCVSVVHLPAPADTLWTAPAAAHLPAFLSTLGFTSLPTFITAFGAGHQLFFSGSVALAVIVAAECLAALRVATAGSKHAKALYTVAAVIACLCVGAHVFASLATRAHWTLDIVAGLLVGAWSHMTSRVLAPRVDAFLP